MSGTHSAASIKPADHSGQYKVRQVRIYTDIPEGPLQQHMVRAAHSMVSPSTSTPNPVVLVTEASLVRCEGDTAAHAHTTQQAALLPASLAFIREWERAKADFKTAVDDPLVWMERVELFVTHQYGLRSGPTAYALHCLQMPVLDLTEATMTSSSASSTPSCTTDAASAGAARAARLPIEQALYFDAARLLTDDHKNSNGGGTTACALTPQEQCIDAFFTTFARSQCGRVISVEVTRPVAVPTSTDRVSPTLAKFIATALTDASAESAQPAAARRVVCVDDAGMPCVWSTASPAGGAPPAPAMPAFQRLLDTLTAKHGSFSDLEHDNPQLVGALCAFNRYQNRGVVRALVQQGFTVAYLNFLRTTAARLCEASETKTNSFVPNLCAVLRFESHWLELPLPTDALVVLSATSNKDVDTTAETCRPAWLTRAKAYAGDGEDRSTQLALLAPWLQREVVVRVPEENKEDGWDVSALVTAVRTLV